jgi:hypothetical protein
VPRAAGTATGSDRLGVAYRLTAVIIELAAVASAWGLLAPSVYRDTPWVLPQNRGQDLVTLLVLGTLVPVVKAARRGSPRAMLVWLGLLGYLAYTYTGAAFAYAFNALFLVYVALFSLTGAALIAGLSGIDAVAVRAWFDARTPRRGVAAFLAAMSVALCLMWMSQIVPFLTDGILPPMIELAKTPTVFVFVLDLGVVVPLASIAAWWLWQDRPWGYVLAAFIVVKAATMGLALVAMTAFAARAGVKVEWAMAIAWAVLAAAGLAVSIWYFSHCVDAPGRRAVT